MNEKIRMVLTFLLGGLFAYAGITKVLDPAKFFVDITNYDVLPWHLATMALAFYLPWLEIICGLAVIGRPFRSGALLISMAMLLTFTAALVQASARGLNITCGCFGGVSDHPRYLLWIGRDAGLLFVSLVLMIGETKAGPSNRRIS